LPTKDGKVLPPSKGSGEVIGELLQGDATNGGWGYHNTAAHEFGHMLGIQHPGQYLKNKAPPNKSPDYDADSWSLMGEGNALRLHYFDYWVAELDRLYPNRGFRADYYDIGLFGDVIGRTFHRIGKGTMMYYPGERGFVEKD
jgi:hypothetical protein